MNTKTLPTLKEGSKGPEVIKLQKTLKELNFYGAIDGIFDPQTSYAVIKFQRHHGLVPDGIVGPKTWSKLNEIGQDNWRRMTETEEINEIKSLISSCIGVAALNQVALEGFIGHTSTRSFYLNERYAGLQTLMRVKGGTGGPSGGIAYNEIRIIFNRFENNIINFDVERVSEETGLPNIQLPD
ncbi:MAG: peptidoglycan-binding domain-containing protein [Rivularia sp. (in: cyanobacteria)]